jgi:signal recognition particle receptor subunit beta
MVLFNYSTKELTAKVVYYGPGLCGKTTNLQWVHEKLPIKNKGKMLSLATETDRTLFFDFLPIEIGTIRGMRTRIQLYTVPGQVFYNATRRMVLKGADAVVFVCDSQEAMLDANLESYENMRQNLEANEIDPEELPIVLQYNKRDLPNALPIEILNERMNPHNVPFNEAVAVKGVGVEDTLKAVTKLVFKALSAKYGDGGAAAASPPGRAPGPPRTSPSPPPPPARPATPPPPLSADELLDGLASSGATSPGPLMTPGPAPAPPSPPRPGTTPPLAPAPPPPAPPRAASAPSGPVGRPIAPRDTTAPGRPSLEVDVEATPAAVLYPGGRSPAGVTASGRVSLSPPESTLRTSHDEAEELRRRIATPGIPDEEIDLEEIQDHDAASAGGRLVLAPDGAHPGDAMMQPEPDGASEAEVEVPIEIEVAPGTSRVSLTLKLVLHLRR